MINRLSIDVFAGITHADLLPIIHNLGFDGFFSDEQIANSYNDLAELKKKGDELFLQLESSHATIPGCHTLWENGVAGDNYVELLKNNIDNCHNLSIPILVVHIQPDLKNNPSFEQGIERLEAVVRYAGINNVKIAFENINSSAYLLRTLDYFNVPHVGFCYDCGHETCYTPETRYLPILGERLLCTHIHDNDGMNDLHLIPFDGIIDMGQMCNELRDCNYKGSITLELSYSARYQNKMSAYDFLNESYCAAVKLRDMIFG